MKSVLISIQPKWCELIASGKKTIEVRKTKPKLETPFKCYIYMTNTKGQVLHLLDNPTPYWETLHLGKGKVIGEFVCDFIANYEAELWDDETYERIQEFFEPDDFAEYGEYEYQTIADNGDDFWRENMLCESSCLTIEELRKYIGTGINEFYGWHISDLVIYDKPKELSEFVIDGCKGCRNKDTYGCKFHCRGKRRIKRAPQDWCYVEERAEAEDNG